MSVVTDEMMRDMGIDEADYGLFRTCVAAALEGDE